MFPQKSFAFSATVKDAFNHEVSHAAGLSDDGELAWVATRGQLRLWTAAQGSYADVLAIPCPGAQQRMVF